MPLIDHEDASRVLAAIEVPLLFACSCIKLIQAHNFRNCYEQYQECRRKLIKKSLRTFSCKAEVYH